MKRPFFFCSARIRKRVPKIKKKSVGERTGLYLNEWGANTTLLVSVSVRRGLSPSDLRTLVKTKNIGLYLGTRFFFYSLFFFVFFGLSTTGRLRPHSFFVSFHEFLFSSAKWALSRKSVCVVANSMI